MFQKRTPNYLFIRSDFIYLWIQFAQSLTPDVLHADGDGFGNLDYVEESYETLEWFVPNGSDCDDTNNEIYPAADEVCDGVDNSHEAFVLSIIQAQKTAHKV